MVGRTVAHATRTYPCQAKPRPSQAKLSQARPSQAKRRTPARLTACWRGGEMAACVPDRVCREFRAESRKFRVEFSRPETQISRKFWAVTKFLLALAIARAHTQSVVTYKALGPRAPRPAADAPLPRRSSQPTPLHATIVFAAVCARRQPVGDGAALPLQFASRYVV